MSKICKVLVVEDDDAVRVLLGDILDLAGYEFKLVANAAQMRAALKSGEYDVAIIDVALRGEEDGFALAELADGHGCNVILTTGDPLQHPRLQESGRRHILKPFRIQELTSIIDTVLKETSTMCVSRHGGAPGTLPLPL